MCHKKQFGVTAVLLLSFSLSACDRNITRVESSQQAATCAQCHDDTNVITGKQTQWSESRHGNGESYARGTSASCAGCHSGNAFANRVAAGLDPNQLQEGDPDPTRQDCRACHQIHTSYTMTDFALKTIEPVALYAVQGVTYDGGDGNLCVNCHQPRRDAPVGVNGVITGISEHWGPHHGPQSAMLLGVAGAGGRGAPSGHMGVENTCVRCHMGEGLDHHFEPAVATCQECHPTASNFDVNGVQTAVQTKLDELGDRLLAWGLINENSPDGHPIVSSAPEKQAMALWNWLYVSHEDKSKGVHNSGYTMALLDSGLVWLPPAPPSTAQLP